MKLFSMSLLVSACVFHRALVESNGRMVPPVNAASTWLANSPGSALTIAQLPLTSQGLELPDRGVPSRREGGGTR